MKLYDKAVICIRNVEILNSGDTYLAAEKINAKIAWLWAGHI